MSNSRNELPVGALLKHADEGQAKPIHDFIIMSEDISNSYLVETADGGVVINAGTREGGAIHRARFATASSSPIRKIIITQSHHDHFGGLEEFMADSPELIVQEQFPDGYSYRAHLKPFYDERAARIWKLILGDRQPGWPEFIIKPDILVGERHEFELGGRKFEVLSVPGGETLDALAVWLPNEKVLFIGNLLGPAYMTVPNLNPIRGDKPRSAIGYVNSVDRMLNLGAETLITGHGEPVYGKEVIAKDLSHMRDAMKFLYNATLDGMATGRSLEALMREVVLPPHLALNEWYGKVAWVVRTVWEEHTGWFQQDFTSRLYEMPVSRVFPDIVALAGAGALADRASQYLNEGRRLQALHLSEIILEAEPGHGAASVIRVAVLRSLLTEAENIRNINEIMWLRTEIAAAE